MTTYYRIHSGDPLDLLDPTSWTSTVWVGDVVRACTECDAGRLWITDDDHEDGGYWTRCETCAGTGEIDDSTRRGVSVCGSYAALMDYMVDRGATVRDTTVLVELTGVPSEDEDWDARDGAVLVYPTTIISSRPLTAAEIALIAET